MSWNVHKQWNVPHALLTTINIRIYFIHVLILFFDLLNLLCSWEQTPCSWIKEVRCIPSRNGSVVPFKILPESVPFTPQVQPTNSNGSKCYGASGLWCSGPLSRDIYKYYRAEHLSEDIWVTGRLESFPGQHWNNTCEYYSRKQQEQAIGTV